MPDNSQYPYTRLLPFIKDGCKQIGEERDFVTYLLSMDQAESIEELVRILNVTFKVLSVIHFGNRKVPSYWYTYSMWGISESDVVRDLFNFFNENILIWYQKQEQNPSMELRALCIANLRNSSNQYKIAEEIIRVKLEENAALISVINREKNNFFSLYSELDSYITNNYKYNEVWAKYKTATKVLAGNGRIFDIIEEEILKKHAIDAEKLRIEYKQELEERKRQEEERRKEEEEKKKKEKNNMIITILIILPILFLLMFLFSKIGLLGIIIIIGFLGAIPKIFLTGKF